MNTFLRHLELAALGDFDCLDGLVARALGNVLDLLHDVVSLEDLAEDDMATIEPAGDDGGDEELGSIGIFQDVSTVMFCSLTCAYPCQSWPC